jgi:hypothetical protein
LSIHTEQYKFLAHHLVHRTKADQLLQLAAQLMMQSFLEAL